MAEFAGPKEQSKWHVKLTPKGQALLPLAGHLIDWAMNPINANLGLALSQEAEAKLPEDAKGTTTQGRQQIEQLDYLINHFDRITLPADLIGLRGATATITRKSIYKLVSAGWLVPIPSPGRTPESYPQFEPSVIFRAPQNVKDFRDVVAKYIHEQWQTSGGAPISLYDLVHGRFNRQFMPGRDNFWRAAFQEYASLRSRRYVNELRPSSYPVHKLALNPVKLAPASNLVELVRGADRNSERYHISGLLKLKKHLSQPSDTLSEIVQKAAEH